MRSVRTLCCNTHTCALTRLSVTSPFSPFPLQVAASIASILPGRRSSTPPDYEDSAPPAPGEGLGSAPVRAEALMQLHADFVKGDVWDMKVRGGLG